MKSRVGTITTLGAASMLLAACSSSKPAPTAPVAERPPMISNNALQPATSTVALPAAPLIRVGLASDQPNASFERIEGGYFIVAGGKNFVLRRGFKASGPLAGQKSTYAAQVAALADRASADALVAKIEKDTTEKATILFDAKSGLYRVLAGTFPDSASAKPLIDQLTKAGYGSGMFAVARPSEQQFTSFVQLVDDEGNEHTFNGDSILVVPALGTPITIAGASYRGGARLFVNNRGTLNIINELTLDDYVRGVVPSEMGPKIYDELEAIKAQALAARTYAVKRLGEYHTEGYDICPTPACQVYKGVAIEEAMSDQAVRETANQVIAYEGQPIDALFTAACGGDTSDVDTMFPGRNEPYLKHVHCVEADVRTLQGRSDGALVPETQLDAAIFEAISGYAAHSSWSARDIVAATEAAAKVAGVTLPTVPSSQTIANELTPPRSSRRGDVLRFLADTLGAAAHGQALTLAEDRAYFFPHRDPNDPEVAAAAFLVKYRILPAQQIDRLDLNAPMPREEYYALLMSWLRKRDLIVEANGRVASVDGRRIGLKSSGKVSWFDIPATAPLFRKTVDRVQEYAQLPYMISDRATVISRRVGGVVAVVVQTNYDGAAFDRTSSFSSWVRSYRADELVQSINKRTPIQKLQDLQTVRIDDSHRIAELNVIAEGGRVIPLKGLTVRWALNVPDNLFTFEKSVDADGMLRFTFFGKGWGHGTGMCQDGAFGMALRGWKAADIIQHYYTGTQIISLQK